MESRRLPLPFKIIPLDDENQAKMAALVIKDEEEAPPAQPPTCTERWTKRLQVLGPGLVVMLADTDAGSLITAAQSGAQWGYSLLLAQIILIPLLYITQDLTVRLGILTGRGHGELIKEAFGDFWAWVSVITLVLACTGAIISEMSGIAAVGEFVNIPKWASALITCVFLMLIVVSGSYRSVERVAMFIGAFELIFLVTMFASPVDMGELGKGLVTFPSESKCKSSLGDCSKDYVLLLAANIGAVIMPWMIFYQQSAVIDKGLTRAEIGDLKWDTAIGAVLTQTVMAAILITVAACVWQEGSKQIDDDSTKLDEVSDIADALVNSPLGHSIGETGTRLLFSLGMLGASLVAAIVVSLTAAWGLGEVAGYKRTLEANPREAPWFYVVYAGVLCVGAAITISPANVVGLNVAIQIMNAALLPAVLGFLFMLAIKALPEEDKLQGWYMWFVGIIFGICSAFGVLGAVMAVVQA